MRTLLLTPLLALLACSASQPDDRPATWSYISTTIIEPACGTGGCHSSLTRTAGLVLDDREQGYLALTGAADAARPIVVPESPEACDGALPFQSQLHYLLHGDGIGRMPPDAPLPAEDIALIERWMCAGAEND